MIVPLRWEGITALMLTFYNLQFAYTSPMWFTFGARSMLQIRTAGRVVPWVGCPVPAYILHSYTLTILLHVYTHYRLLVYPIDKLTLFTMPMPPAQSKV